MREIADASINVRMIRHQIMQQNKWSLRELYRSLEQGTCQALQTAQQELDKAVRSLYGMAENQDPLEFLLNLNLEVAMKEDRGEPVIKAGFPEIFQDAIVEFITDDCVQIP